MVGRNRNLEVVAGFILAIDSMQVLAWFQLLFHAGQLVGIIRAYALDVRAQAELGAEMEPQIAVETHPGFEGAADSGIIELRYTLTGLLQPAIHLNFGNVLKWDDLTLAVCN
ncbi:MAG: hypothetical protein ACR2QJ_05165 [Geminicoccaceae bacterium]